MTPVLEPATLRFARGQALTESLRRTLARGSDEARRRSAPVLVSATVRIPRTDALEAFARSAYDVRMLWEQPSRDFALAGLGAVLEITGDGSNRFRAVAEAWRALLDGAVIEAPAGCPVAAPICLGGFSFDPERRAAPQWEAFGPAALILPRRLLISHGDASWLTTNVLIRPGDDARALAEALESELAAPAPGRGAPDRACDGQAVPPATADAADAWKDAVRAAIDDIRRGTVEKLVLAREVHVRASAPFDVAAALRHLRSAYAACTVFALARGDAVFLGATPEQLVRVTGGRVQTMCLAGSAPRGETEADDEALGAALLADPKERHEHAVVVRAQRDAVAPLCSEVTVPDEPGLLRMRNVQHLHTPIEGVLRDGHTLLSLVERLHPTPAVGGHPCDTALPLIRSYEPFDRGWYAAPVGWLGGDGSGEFVVAIRSALVRGRDAWLYAGCGIVADSDPERELRESEIKLRAMRGALRGTEEGLP